MKKREKTPLPPSEPVLGKVAAYCRPAMLTAVLIPTVLFLLSALFSAVGWHGAAGVLFLRFALPLAGICPFVCFYRAITAIRGAFPRAGRQDEWRVLGAILFCTGAALFLLLTLTWSSCLLLPRISDDFPLAERLADAAKVSPQATGIAVGTVFFLYAVIAMLLFVSDRIGHRVKKAALPLSCGVFAVGYLLILLAFLAVFFIATFLDITALENVQITDSLLSANLLCAYLAFDLTAAIALPVLFAILLRSVKKDPAKATEKQQKKSFLAGDSQ